MTDHTPDVSTERQYCDGAGYCIKALTRATPTPADQGDLVGVVTDAILTALYGYKIDPFTDPGPWEFGEKIACAVIDAMPAVGNLEFLRERAESAERIAAGLFKPGVSLSEELSTLRTQLAERDETIAKYERVMRPIKFIADTEERAESNASVMVNVNRCRDVRDALTPQVPHG